MVDDLSHPPVRLPLWAGLVVVGSNAVSMLLLMNITLIAVIALRDALQLGHPSGMALGFIGLGAFAGLFGPSIVLVERLLARIKPIKDLRDAAGITVPTRLFWKITLAASPIALLLLVLGVVWP